jgi:excisionase family DNA binding protein
VGNLILLSSRRRAPSEPWLRKGEIAAHLGVSQRWVEKRAADSGLPFHRVGQLNLYRVSEVDRWVESNGA